MFSTLATASFFIQILRSFRSQRVIIIRKSWFQPKHWHLNQTAACGYVLWLGPYSVFYTLSRQFFKQLASGPILLYLGVQFVHIVGHRQQEDLSGYLPVTAQQELPESVVLLDDTKGSL